MYLAYGQFSQGLISPTFYSKLLLAQIPKIQKDTNNLAVFLCFWDLLESRAKALRETLAKLTPGLNFINVLRTAFTLADPKSVKRY
jgi:hypothetical protein